ncbi:hypothetical protein MTBLM1_10486 [Rhodospirillaceae bacterium LM-1]|nr:hypothetical protein MTBLM1_10486 [Rhodospirillaceae bacterium LM-1]
MIPPSGRWLATRRATPTIPIPGAPRPGMRLAPAARARSTSTATVGWNNPLCMSADKKRPVVSHRPFPFLQGDLLVESPQINSLGTLGVLAQFERNSLAFVQALKPRTFQSRDMHEHILAAVFRSNEAETLGRIEPLHGACSHWHVLSFTLNRSSRPRPRGMRRMDCAR